MSRTACGREVPVLAFPQKEGDDFAPDPCKNACRGGPLCPPVPEEPGRREPVPEDRPVNPAQL